MDNQSTPPNSAGSAEQPSVAGSEQIAAGAVEQSGGAETAPAPGGAGPQDPAAVVPPAPTLTAADVAAAIAAAPVAAGPAGATPQPTPAMEAADVDVIEPEWVDRAEGVVKQHQGDPYAEEEGIEDLQQEYLKKRYGYNVGDPNSDGSKPEGT